MTKGAAMITATTYWRATLGDVMYERVLSRVPPETREQLENPPLAVSWIPFAHTRHFLESLVEIIGAERAAATYEALGAKMLEQDLRGIYRALLRIVTIDFAMQRAGKMFGQYNRDAGTLSTTRDAPRRVSCHYRDLPMAHIVFARFLAGAARGVVSLATGKPARVAACTLLPGNGVDVAIEWDG